MKRALRTNIVLCAAAALASGVVPAMALTSVHSSWHVVYRHQFAARYYSSFRVITPAGRGEMWAAGGYGVAGPGLAGAVLWKNRAWHVTSVPDSEALGFIEALSADSASDAWAVAANGYVIRWDGRRWRVAKRLPEPNIGFPGDMPTGVLAVSARSVWVFYGTWRDSRNHLHGGALHYLNGIWRQVTGPGRTIIAASEATPTDLWAIGGSDSNRVGLLRYGRQGWKPVTAPALTGLTFGSVLALRDGQVWALGWPSAGTGTTELVELSGGHWSRHPLPAKIHQDFGMGAGELASDGHRGIWVAAPAFYPYSGHLLHLVGRNWQQIGLGAKVNAYAVVAVPRSDTLCAAGSADNNNSYGTVWSTARSC